MTYLLIKRSKMVKINPKCKNYLTFRSKFLLNFNVFEYYNNFGLNPDPI